MAHLIASRYVVVAAFATSSHALSDARIPLASSVQAKKPTSVLVHGLDSSKETWTSTLAALQSASYPCLALDHGCLFLSFSVPFVVLLGLRVLPVNVMSTCGLVRSLDIVEQTDVSRRLALWCMWV